MNFQLQFYPGSCLPLLILGGQCSGTPWECQDCNKVVTCRDESLNVPPPTLIEPSYGNYPEIKEALEDTSFNVKEHECYSLLGENGAGKSTTFKILTRDVRQTEGSVYLLDDQSLVEKEMGYCPQDDVLFDLLTVQEHLYFYA